MKNLLRILIVATFFGIIFYYTSASDDESEPIRGNSPTQAIPRTEVEELSMYLPRPLEGLSTYIGKNAGEIIQQFGAPTRIDPSGYQYDWWIYMKDYEFIMFSVQDDIVTQVYTTSSRYNVAPYSIGQSLEDIYRMTIVESEIAVTVDETIYMFLMDEVDLKTRILVAFEDDVFAQLYIDQHTNKLIGIRFIEGETLVRHKPYEFQYIGEMIQQTVPSSFEQYSIDLAYAKQIYNLVNEFRLLSSLPKLLTSPILNEAAMKHSEHLALKDLNSSEEENITLETRLKENGLEYKKLGENLAVNYYDAIEVIHGWMNSKEHRATLLNERYNISGTGVYLKNFTQLFIERETPIDN